MKLFLNVTAFAIKLIDRSFIQLRFSPVVYNAGICSESLQVKSLEQRLQVTEKRLRLCYEDRASYLTKIEDQLISENARLHVCATASFANRLQQERTKMFALT